MSYRINLRRHDNITFSASRDDILYRSSRHQITLLSRHFWSSSIFVIAVRSSVDIQASFQMLFAPPFICLWYGICFRSRFYNHVETIHGVNSCSSLHANIFRFAYQFEVEFVHNHRQSYRSFQHSELIPNTFPLSCTKRKECIISCNFIRIKCRVCKFIRVKPIPSFYARVFERAFPSRRVVLLGVLPILRCSVEIPSRNKNIRSSQYLNSARQSRATSWKSILRSGTTNEHRWLRVQAQCLDQSKPQFFHRGNVIEVRTGFVAHDRSDFRLDFFQQSWVAAC
mmetsp:Transcript_15160/g.31783  ORF Transcript_15160/g.31783 Transcript_15160/m.31783 type:complete len:283 (-) Transcript_15160:1754-2602(-)